MPLRHTIVFMLVMTVLMGLVLSGWFTWQAQGFAPGFIMAWLSRFGATYVVVLPTVVVVLPVARAIAGRINAVWDR